MTTATILPSGRTQFIAADGSPLVGGKVFFYIPNTSTPKNTWQDAGQITLNTNPVILDSLGSALIYGSGQYRQVLEDSAGNVLWDVLTQDILGLFATQTSPSNGTALIGFLYPGGVSRTLYSKLLDYDYSVQDFGAVGDGATDDTTAIQNALTNLNSNGGVLYFPPGRYRITSGLSVTFTYTLDSSIKRPQIVGAGAGLSQLVWDGANSPSTFMLSILRTESSDSNALHAHSVISGLGFMPINSGKNYYASGLYLQKWSYIHGHDMWANHLDTGFDFDQVISSKFDTINSRFNNIGLKSIGTPSSVQSGVYANNALTFINCEIGNNNNGGFLAEDGTFTFIGGAIEQNGQSGTAGSGYGAKINNTAAGSPNICSFIGTYFEANGTTGDAGTNASTADVWIIHNDTADNLNYTFLGCAFIRLTSNYAPYGIFLNKSTTTTASLTVNGCIFTDYSYTPSSNRKNIKITDTSGTTHVTVAAAGNFFNQSTEEPDFIAGTTYYPSVPGYANNKSFSALVYLSTANQAITTATFTPLTWDTAIINDCTMWVIASPTKLTVPAGVTRVRLYGNLRFESTTVAAATYNYILTMQKNGSRAFVGVPASQIIASGGTLVRDLNVSSPILNVIGGDYFELLAYQNSGSDIHTDNSDQGAIDATWFAMEIIQ